MDIETKKLYHRASRHREEAYFPVVAQDGSGLCYLKIEEGKESLIYQKDAEAPESVISRGTYLFTPCFAGKYLFWIEKCGGDWLIKAKRKNEIKTDCGKLATAPFVHTGRPLSLSS